MGAGGAHKIACRNDVAWMFEQWDGDNNGLLSKALKTTPTRHIDDDELRPNTFIACSRICSCIMNNKNLLQKFMKVSNINDFL
ncbi:hypothetical protein ANCCEY_13261 [Ancylostoma ceylanicum]|uniref:Uncharacterized protein n=1 Tax=Ancylostoma ceylanicum TaxID=53326 RepID=A0A0D6LJ36_9BILA|nr:hypothetical protein ANCCEY_13261 [Ancylostoma ceylanicum]